jgi:hypothetical protein
MKLENAIKKPNKKSLAACPIMLCILLTDDNIWLYFGKTNQSYNIYLKDTQGHMDTFLFRPGAERNANTFS